MDPGQITITRDDGSSLLIHRGTVFRVNEFEPYDQFIRADQGGDAPWSDGGWSGAEWQDQNTVPMKLGIHTESEAELMAAWWALRAALAPVRTGGDVEVTWNAAGTEYLMYARPRTTRLKKEGSTGIGWVTTQFECPDPAVYSALEHVVEIGLLHRIGGLTVPFGLPASINQVVADGETTLVNSGTGEARLSFHIEGPITRPRISLVYPSGTQTLYLDSVIGAGEFLDIDTKDRFVILNGTTTRLADQYGAWPLLTGTVLLRFEADAYSPNASLTIRHRDTY